ncbi:helix-turn-helix domain-containing protein, partial [Leucobacter sp. M11]|uniref:helix-turn-helix domain-containing protein n=1 Tax=Leucobacter sp. M11 TaxID=2993565 RepID=UPI002D7EF7A1
MPTPISSPHDLGALVRVVRKRRGLSQVELSAQLGVTQRWLSELETGRGKHFDDRFFRVLGMLGIQLSAKAELPAATPEPSPATEPRD